MLKFAKFAKLVPAVVAAALLAVAATSPARAFTIIPTPDAAYLASTTEIPVPGSDFSTLGAITDGTETVTFSSTLTRYTNPGSWATWSAPPFSQSGTPHRLLYSGSRSLSMTLGTPTSIFGFEAEPNPFSLQSFTVDFYRLGSLIGSTSRSIHGSAGARLLAASDPGGFDRIDVTATSDFAIGHPRYGAAAATTPEPGTLALLATGVLPLARKLRRRREEA